jgi:hypothetical protein
LFTSPPLPSTFSHIAKTFLLLFATHCNTVLCSFLFRLLLPQFPSFHFQVVPCCWLVHAMTWR